MSALSELGVIITPPTREDPYYHFVRRGRPELSALMYYLDVSWEPEVKLSVLETTLKQLELTIHQFKAAVRETKERRRAR
ncbi:MAG: hypothetical protein HY814_05910 [Candidatus Riflebacteria bacterium]|nr:hypothetical protein [Candidatus Riflebacteria bacterium]